MRDYLFEPWGPKWINPCEGGEGDPPGGGGGTAIFDINSPEAKAAIAIEVGKLTAASEAGLVAKRDELLGEVKLLKEKFAPFADLGEKDITDLRALQAQVSDAAEKELLKEGKIDELIDRRLKATTDNFEKQRKEQETETGSLKALLNKSNEKVASLTINASLQAEATKAGARPEAIEDIIRSGRDVFKLDDELKPVPRGPDGEILKNKEGEVITPALFVDDLKKTKPYYFPGSGGGGAPGGSGEIAEGDFTITKTEANDVEKYRAAKDRAQKAGKTLQILDE